VLDLASESSDVVGDQRTANRDGEYQPFPSALATYDASVDDIRSNVPLFDSIIAGDSYNVRTENGDGERVTVRYVDTGSSGEIADYELESGDSVDADVVLDELTFSEITEADDSMATAVDAYQSGDVQVDPNGFGNVIKYKTLPQLISALSGLF
jgi:stress response protein SCP2